MPLCTEIIIGFQNSSYVTREPQEETKISGVIQLEKQGGRVSEQTFLIAIEASATTPNANIPSATLSSFNNDGTVSNNDYSIAGPGESVVVLEFRPEDQAIDFEFTLYPDNLNEGQEAFQLGTSRGFLNGVIGPLFAFPSSGVLFSSSYIFINESEFSVISYMKQNHIFHCSFTHYSTYEHQSQNRRNSHIHCSSIR